MFPEDVAKIILFFETSYGIIAVIFSPLLRGSKFTKAFPLEVGLPIGNLYVFSLYTIPLEEKIVVEQVYLLQKPR